MNRRPRFDRRPAIVEHAPGRPGGGLSRYDRRVLFLARARDLRVLVLVLGVAGGAAGLKDILPNHRHNCVVGQPPLARTVVIQNVTKPKLALLHQELPKAPI